MSRSTRPRAARSFARRRASRADGRIEPLPAALGRIRDAPAFIYVRGDPSAWQRPVLAVVGTRDPTSAGEAAARAITRSAVQAGFAIVSGLAPGIDEIAHATALDAGGRTAAVVASGLDRIARPDHAAELVARILEGGGALLSEQPPGTEASPETRVARNRIQTALADAVVVVEAGLEDGSMHTARFAVEQGKPLYCPVPENPEDGSAGVRALLATVARPLGAGAVPPPA